MSIPSRHIRYLIMPAVVLALASCAKQTPREKILENETFAQIYVALQEEGTKLRNVSPDSASVFDPKSVLSRFNVSEEEFRATVHFYNEDLTRWKSFFSEVAKQSEPNEKK
jgi:hypothetical protein